MKNNGVFVLLGPFLAWLIGIVLASVSMYPRPVFEEWHYWPASFMVCYTFSFPPLLLTAWVDRRLSRHRWRFLVCGLAGFGIAVALYSMLMHEGGREADAALFWENWFYVGLVWGLPAAMCSLLAGEKQEG
jgi:hypothetical protein